MTTHRHGFSVLLLVVSAAACRPSTTVSSSPAAGGDDVPRNGLAPEALRVSPALLHWLPTVSLGAVRTPPDAVERELHDATHRCGDARPGTCASKLFAYVVSCALAPGQSAVIGPGPRVKGELGLCPGWSSGPPDAECRQAVSSCVLARLNALDKEVAISFRGERGSMREMLPRIPVEKTYREREGTIPIASFAPCSSGPGPVCGWEPRWVGRCTPGRSVRIEPPRGTRVRVCKGLHGCDPKTQHPPYAGFVAEGAEAFTFPCATGRGRASGYFSVMVKEGDLSAQADIRPHRGDDYVYPAREDEVFTYAEGAFFGDVFHDAEKPVPTSYVPSRPPLFDEQYACYAEGWDDGRAHLADRLCATTEGTCFGNTPRRCLSASPRVCEGGPPAGASFKTCSGIPGPDDAATPARPTGPWAHGVTVFLNDPCDLSDNPKACGPYFF